MTSASLDELEIEGTTYVSQLAISAKSSDDDFRLLVQELYPVIKSLVRTMSYKKAYDTQDEFLQLMLIELWNAVKTFDPDRKVPFEWFARDYLYKRSRSILRSKFYTRRSAFNLQSIRSEDSSDEDRIDHAFFVDNYGPLYKVWEQNVRTVVFDKCSKSLTKLEGNVLYLWYIGYTYKDIEERLHINHKAIDNTMMRVKKKLRADNEVCELYSFWREVSEA